MEIPTESAAEPASQLRIDRRRGVIMWRGSEVAVRAKAWEVLLYLAARPGELITAEELRRAVWSDVTVSTKTVHNVVAELRQALPATPHTRSPIETVKRRGYRIAVHVLSSAADPPASAGTSRTPPDSERALLPRPQLVTRLYEEWRKSLMHRAGAALLIGEPGAGKTTTLRAFLDLLSAERPPSAAQRADAWPQIAFGCCLDRPETREPFGPLLMALASVVSVRPGIADVMRRLAPTWLLQFPGLLEPAQTEQLLRLCLGSSLARRGREGAALFEALAADEALVLALEDLHWADADTLDLLIALARMGRRVPLCIVATLRRYPGVSAAPVASRIDQLRRLATAIEVPPFTPQEVHDYLCLRLDDAGVAPELAARFEERSSGNPLILQSLSRQWLDSGLLQRRDDGWRLDAQAGLATQMLGTDVTLIIASQLHALDAESARLLEAASLIGDTFSVEALTNALGIPAAAIEPSLAALVRHEIVRPYGAGRFAFAHAVHRQVVREAVAIERRGPMHAAIARYLAARPITPDEPFAPAQIATHYAVAAEWEAAAQYFEYAAHSATGRLDYDGAAAAIEHALACLGRLPATPASERRQAHLQLLLGNLVGIRISVASPLVLSGYQAAARLFDTHGDTVEAFRARLGVAFTYILRGDGPAARAAVDRLLIAAEAGVPGMVAAALTYSGTVWLLCGEVAAAQRALQHSLAEPASPDMPRLLDLRMLTHYVLASAHAVAGDRAAARAAQAAGAARAAAYAQPSSQPFYFMLDALAASFIGDAAVAHERVAAAEELSERYAYFRVAPMSRFLRHWAAAHGRGNAAALDAMVAALAEHEASGSHWLLPQLGALLTESYIDAGQLEAARQTLERSQAWMERSGQRLAAAELLRLRARLLVERATALPPGSRDASRDEAASVLRQAIALAQHQGAGLFARRARAALRRLAHTASGNEHTPTI